MPLVLGLVPGNDGSIVTDLDHDTHVNREVAIESVPQPFGLTGREYDRVSGLYHLRNRDYDPNAGRFLQEDPIWFNAGDLNVYRYTWNNPTKYTDPSGMVAAFEYACLADFGFHASTVGGSLAGLGIAGVFSDIISGFGGDSQNLVGIVAAQQAAIVTFAASFQRIREEQGLTALAWRDARLSDGQKQ